MKEPCAKCLNYRDVFIIINDLAYCETCYKNDKVKLDNLKKEKQ